MTVVSQVVAVAVAAADLAGSVEGGAPAAVADRGEAAAAQAAGTVIL